MPLFSAIAMGATALTGLAKAVSGASQSRRNKKLIDNYERQTLDNVFKDIPISTIGSDLMREEAARIGATALATAVGGGVRGVMGGIPQIMAQNNKSNQEGRAYLDNQVQKRNELVARDDQRIRQMTEQRENADLAALGQQFNAGKQDMWNGIGDITNAAMFASQNIFSTPQVNSVVDSGFKASGTQALSGGAQISSGLTAGSSPLANYNF